MHVVSILSLLAVFLSLTSAEEQYQKEALKSHNYYRIRHGSRLLLSSPFLNKQAVVCAEYYLRKNKIDHSCPYYTTGVGENLFQFWGPDVYNIGGGKDHFGESATDAWYSEYKIHEAKSHNYTKWANGAGHFTQLVWNDSRYLGYGVAQSHESTVAVAIFKPGGNLPSMVRYHVKPMTPELIAKSKEFWNDTSSDPWDWKNKTNLELEVHKGKSK